MRALYAAFFRKRRPFLPAVMPRADSVNFVTLRETVLDDAAPHLGAYLAHQRSVFTRRVEFGLAARSRKFPAADPVPASNADSPAAAPPS
jgi:hypothetical protein